MRAVMDGDLPAWREGSARTIKVQPGDMAAFDLVFPDRRDDAFPCDALITKDDAGELLNTHAKYLPEIRAEFELDFVEVGRADRAIKEAVLAVAAQMASSAEIGFHLGIHSNAVGPRMASLGVMRRGLGWDRAMLQEKSILPKARG